MPTYLSESGGAGLFRIAQFRIVLRNLVNEPFCTVFRPNMSETEHASREPYCPSNQAADPLLGDNRPGTEFRAGACFHRPSSPPSYVKPAFVVDIASAYSYRSREEEEMFRTSKKLERRIVFALLYSAMFAATLPSFAAGSELSEGAALRQNDVKKMQQALLDRGHYRGKIDGVMGLRTGESIRAFQRAEKLPATGRLDPQTAGKLGVNPESIRRVGQAKRDTVEQQDKSGNQVGEGGKPWAGTILVKSARRTRGTLPRVSSAVDPDDKRPKTRGNVHREQ